MSVQNDVKDVSMSGVGQGERTGGQAVAEALRNCDVEVVFGYQGGGVMHLLNDLVEAGIRTISGRTELGAGWMSYGYNRARRRAASACMVHAVGALHVSPVVYGAKVDSTPFFLLEVNLGQSLDLRDPLQVNLDLLPSLQPLSKFARRITTAEDIPLAVRQAVMAASTGKHGSAVLDIAFDALSQPTICPAEPLSLPVPPAAPQETVDYIVSRLSSAERPVIVAGAGVHTSDGAEVLQQVAEATGVPVVSTSWGGRGVLPDRHPLYAGPIGSFGWTSANEVAQRSDLWVTFGVSFSQMSTAAWSLTKPDEVIQIEIDASRVGMIFQPSLGVVADARQVLEQILNRVDAPEFGRREPWIDIEQLKSDWHRKVDEVTIEDDVPINQYYMLKVMSEELPAGTITVGDSGGNAFIAHRSVEMHETQRLATGSRYMSLGASLPVAIGAKLAQPERTVVSYHGDGGFYYDFAEIATLAEHDIKVIIVLDNNGVLLANQAGMKMIGVENAPWCELPPTDFVRLANALGIEAERVEKPEDFRPALRRAMAAEASYLIDAVTTPGIRMKRAIDGVVPIFSDRNPRQEMQMSRSRNHWVMPLDGAWPRS